MGGCCSSAPGADKDRTPVYYYCPQTLEERKPVSFINVTTSAVTPALFSHSNLDSSVPNASQAPPAPVLCDVSLADTLPVKNGNCTGHMQLKGSGSVSVAEAVEDENLEGSDCKNEVISQKETLMVEEDECSKSSEPDVLATEEEDVCPTCLEDYDLENPRIVTKCEHHFHLSCILEWMERSDTCPICDQIMMFEMGSEESL